MNEFVEKTPYYSNEPIALVIGCGDMGIGSARALGKRHPLLVVDINPDLVERTVAALSHDGYTVSGHVCDIADKEQVKALGDLLAKGPGVKVLAHVAAVGNTPHGWRLVIDVDLIGPYLIAAAVGPHMVPGGVAIWISSTGAYLWNHDPRIVELTDNPLSPTLKEDLVEAYGKEPDFLQAYYWAKYAMNRMAGKLADAWGENEVRSLSLSPGLINTTMGRTGGRLLPVYNADGEEKRQGTRSEKALVEVPLKRQGTTLEIIAVVDFLASDAASYVNGIDVVVDGGAGARRTVLGIDFSE